MRILGIDYGDVRTGLAVSDPLGYTAQGLESVKHGNNEKILLNKIGKIIKEYEIKHIVIGFPLNMNATIGPRAQKTQAFVEKIEKQFGIEVEKIDERLTTVSANKAMTNMRVTKGKKKSIVDTIAATYILQIYLDRNRNI